MTAATLPLEMEQGITFTKTLTWKTGEPAMPVNLAGCTARMQLREFIGAPEALLTLTSENGGIVLGGLSGQITLQISAAQTRQLVRTNAVYSLRIVFANETVKRLAAGSVNISLDATSD